MTTNTPIRLSGEADGVRTRSGKTGARGILKFVAFTLCAITFATAAQSQELAVSPETLAKRAKRKNLTIKEWNTEARTKSKWLDHVTVYDDEGRKIEETEYASYGQRERITCQYDPATGKILKEIVYDDRNKPSRIRKYEYNADGTKKKQYNYLPNGKLFSVKVFEYILSDSDQ